MYAVDTCIYTQHNQLLHDLMFAFSIARDVLGCENVGNVYSWMPTRWMYMMYINMYSYTGLSYIKNLKHKRKYQNMRTHFKCWCMNAMLWCPCIWHRWCVCRCELLIFQRKHPELCFSLPNLYLARIQANKRRLIVQTPIL